MCVDYYDKGNAMEWLLTFTMPCPCPSIFLSRLSLNYRNSSHPHDIDNHISSKDVTSFYSESKH